MSETKKVKLHTIPLDAISEIKLSGAFHKRLVGLYFNYVSKFETEQFQKFIDYIENKEANPLEGQELVDATSLETLLILIYDAEHAFKEAGFGQEEEIEMPNED